MLAFARAIIPGPALLLMDEPLEGLAPRIREELMDAILNLIGSTGLSCILVEQHVDVVLNFADEILILERGRPVFLGSPAELQADPSILDRTIGLRKASMPRGPGA
jgi:branched-chain amino acid transport system ATP-binding protein